MAWVNPWFMVFRHLPRVPLYSVVVNIMKFYRHDRDSNPDRCSENQTCEPLHHRPIPLPDELVCNPKLFADVVSLISVMHDQNSHAQSLRDDLGTGLINRK